jgi:hypothetical protein
MNCVISFMAKKIISFERPQKTHGTPEGKDRQPAVAGLSAFMHVPPKLKINPAKRRLQLVVPIEEPEQIPQSVKISHVD